MKYKNYLTKSNYIFISIIVVICIINIYLLIINKFYITSMFLIIIMFILVISYINMYFYISDKFIVLFGLIKFKYNYESITNIEKINNKVKVSIGNIDYIINTIDNNLFIKELMDRSDIK